MPTYVTMYRFTEQGVKGVKQSPKRLEAGVAHTLAQTSLGNVRSTTMRAFTPKEFAEIVKKIP